MITRFRFASPSLYSSSRWARLETAFSSKGSILVDTLEASIKRASKISIFFSFSRLISRKSWASISSFNSNFLPFAIPYSPRRFGRQRLYVVPLAFGPDFIGGIQNTGIGLFHSRPRNVFPQFPAKKIIVRSPP